MSAHIYTEIVHGLVLGVLCLGIAVGVAVLTALFFLLKAPGVSVESGMVRNAD